MSVTPIQLYEGDGSTTDFTYGFPLRGSFAVLLVKVKEEADPGLTQLTDGIEYDHFPDLSLVRFRSGYVPGDGAIIRLERFTTRDRLNDYISGSTIKQRDLDNDFNRLTNVDEEIEAGAFDGMRKNDAGNAWNAEGLPSENAAPATEPTGWVTLAQMLAALNNVQVAELGDPRIFTWVADGTETEFEINGIAGLKVGQPNLWVNSVPQTNDISLASYQFVHADDSAYPSGGDGDDYLVFDEPPPADSLIELKLFTGTTLGVLADDAINDPDQVADDVIGLQHLNFGSGDATRLLVLDADGDPTARRIGIADLLASGALGSAVRSALTDISTGLRLNDFLRLNGGDVPLAGYKLTGVGSPTNDTDGANKSYVDSKLIQVATGTTTTGLPNGALGQMDITVGFVPQFFALGLNYTIDDVLFHWWISTSLEWVLTPASTWSALGVETLRSRISIKNLSTTKMRVLNGPIASGTFPSFIRASWFAIRLGN